MANRIDLSELHRAWDGHRYPHREVVRFDARPPELGRDVAMDVLVFVPDDDDDEGAQTWFTTAGLSELPHRSDVGRFELELAVRGRLEPAAREQLARSFATLAIGPFRLGLVMRRDLLIGCALSAFPGRTAVIITDAGWSSPEYLPGLTPRVRVLEVLTLYEREAEQLRRVGPEEARTQFLDAGVDLIDPERSIVDLEPPDRPLRVSSKPMTKAKAGGHDLAAIWAAIDPWLAANAPTTASDLQPGASAETIASAERTIGRALPPDVVASYRIHDGYAGFGGYEYLSLEAALELWGANGEQPRTPAPKKSAHQGKIKKAFWHPAWFPVASDSSGGLVCVDLDPEPSGTLGQLVIWHGEEGPKVSDFTGWGDWLSQFRDELVAGGFGQDENGRLLRPESDDD